MGRGKRGLTVGMYVAALAVFAVFALTLVTMAVHHLNFAGVAYQQQAAKNMAEAAIHQALVTILESPGQHYGQQGLPAEVVRLTSSLYPAGTRGIVCFDKVTAKNEKLPYSINNFNGPGQLVGSLGGPVPVNTLHLVGTGLCGEVRKTVEALYYVPPFPSALASEGPVRSHGGLLVAGVKDPSKFPGHYQDLAPEEKSPSHVFSNFNGPKAVELGPGAVIQGNVGAVGGILLDPNVKVAGEVRPYGEPQPLPKIDMDGVFQRLSQQMGKDMLSPTISGDYSLEWNAQCDTDLHITGSVQLNQGVLFVKGNLQIDGGITGEGAIYVGGKTLVKRGANFRATDQVAILSRQRVVLDGAGQDSYFFQGLIYSEQEVVAHDITVLGAVIARGLGGLEFENVNVLNSPITINLVEGVELRNQSDDDTVQVIVRVEERDPLTHLPISYKVQLRGISDDVVSNDGPTTLSAPIEGHGLRNYDEVKHFIESSDRSIWGPYAKNAFRLDWYWNAGDEHADVYGPNPLQTYLDILSGKISDPSHRMTLNLNPNEVLGIMDRSRVLLWRDAANPY